MSVNTILPFLSTVVMAAFTFFVLRRYIVRRKPHFLFWGIGLAMFGVGSFAEAYLALDWNKWVFFSWYLFGAILTAAWIGHGTLYLLFRKPWVHGVTIILILGSIGASILMLRALPTLDTTVFTTDRPISEQYGTKEIEAGETPPEEAQTEVITYRGEEVTVSRGIIPLGAAVRFSTIPFNIYGTLTLVGGAIWSSYLFLRKRVLPNRVMGNVLIAAGALSIAMASTLTRLGYGSLLYLGELVAAVLMFSGFLIAARPQRVESESPVAAPASAAD